MVRQHGHWYPGQQNKKIVRKLENERVPVEHTHEPLISQEQWDIVQDVRKHKKRVPKHMNEPNLFEEEPVQIVLDDLRRVTHFARMKEWQFAEHINQKNTLELRWEIDRVLKELDSMRRRNGELSVLFKQHYEDNVLGRVTNEQFRMLSADYNDEQKELESAIPAKEEQLEGLKASVANVDTFIEKAKQYAAINGIGEGGNPLPQHKGEVILCPYERYQRGTGSLFKAYLVTAGNALRLTNV